MKKGKIEEALLHNASYLYEHEPELILAYEEVVWLNLLAPVMHLIERGIQDKIDNALRYAILNEKETSDALLPVEM